MITKLQFFNAVADFALKHRKLPKAVTMNYYTRCLLISQSKRSEFTLGLFLSCDKYLGFDLTINNKLPNFEFKLQ